MIVRTFPLVFACLSTAVTVSLLAPSSAAAQSTGGASVPVGPDVVQGRFVTRVATRFDGTSDVVHYLEDGQSVVPIRLDLSAHPGVARGAVIRAHGTRTGSGALVVDGLDIVEPAPQPLIGPTPRPPRRIAAIMVHWGSPDSMTQQQLQQRVFTNETSTRRFYVENSYGKENFIGDVFGWYQIATPPDCDYTDYTNGGIFVMADAAKAAFAADGNNLDDYDQFMIYFPRWNACGWGGLAEVGAPDAAAADSWYNGSAGCVVLAQELGHNYGMLHSHSYQGCGGTPYSDSCSSNEYGHPYDPMGGGCGHINNYQKDYMGWHEECNLVTATGDGTFNLAPLELPCNGIQSLRLPISDDLSYYVEYRQPVGAFDANDGVLVHVSQSHDGSGSDYGGPEGWLLDMDQSTSGWYMHAGDSYDDYMNRVSFEVLEENDTHAVISVTYPGGGSGSPTCLDDTMPPMEASAWGSLECSEEPPGDDTSPPTVSITAPANGDTFAAPANFTVTATASDDMAVAQVELLMNGTSVAVDGAAPYEWDVTDLVAGTYEFVARAADGQNQTSSDPVTVEVTGDGDTDTGDDGDTDTGDDGDTDTGDDGDTDTGDDGDTDTGDDGNTDTGDEDDGATDTGDDTNTGDGDPDDDGGTATGDSSTGDGSTGGDVGDDGTPPPTPTTTGTLDDSSDPGCGCRGANPPDSLAWLMFGAIPFLRRRRRLSR